MTGKIRVESEPFRSVGRVGHWGGLAPLDEEERGGKQGPCLSREAEFGVTHYKWYFSTIWDRDSVKVRSPPVLKSVNSGLV